MKYVCGNGINQSKDFTGLFITGHTNWRHSDAQIDFSDPCNRVRKLDGGKSWAVSKWRELTGKRVTSKVRIERVYFRAFNSCNEGFYESSPSCQWGSAFIGWAIGRFDNLDEVLESWTQDRNMSLYSEY